MTSQKCLWTAAESATLLQLMSNENINLKIYAFWEKTAREINALHHKHKTGRMTCNNFMSFFGRLFPLCLKNHLSLRSATLESRFKTFFDERDLGATGRACVARRGPSPRNQELEQARKTRGVRFTHRFVFFFKRVWRFSLISAADTACKYTYETLFRDFRAGWGAKELRALVDAVEEFGVDDWEPIFYKLRSRRGFPRRTVRAYYQKYVNHLFNTFHPF